MRIALNPIQWMASDDGWLDPSLAPEREELLGLIKKAGFDAVMAEVPAGHSCSPAGPPPPSRTTSSPQAGRSHSAAACLARSVSTSATRTIRNSG